MRIQQVKDNKIQYLDLLQFAGSERRSFGKKTGYNGSVSVKGRRSDQNDLCCQIPEKPEVRDFEHCNHGRSAWMWLR